MKNKIGWCNLTFNPVWGCLSKCPYCYARAIAKRFYRQIYELEVKRHFERHPTWAWTGDHLKKLRDFGPTFLYSQYCKKLPKKPQRIFVGSMSEIYYWEPEWVEMVIEKVKQYPQHIFQFLTKFPRVYYEWAFPPENCWLGITVTGKENINDMQRIYEFSEDNANLEYHNIKFISFEPLLDGVSPKFMTGINWVIIGAETGNRKGKITPNGSWVFNIFDYCKNHNTPIYIKNSLVKYYSEYGGYKEFPEVK